MIDTKKAFKKLDTAKKHLKDCMEFVTQEHKEELQHLINLVDYMKDFIKYDHGGH